MCPGAIYIHMLEQLALPHSSPQGWGFELHTYFFLHSKPLGMEVEGKESSLQPHSNLQWVRDLGVPCHSYLIRYLKKKPQNQTKQHTKTPTNYLKAQQLTEVCEKAKLCLKAEG